MYTTTGTHFLIAGGGGEGSQRVMHSLSPQFTGYPQQCTGYAQVAHATHRLCTADCSRRLRPPPAGPRADGLASRPASRRAITLSGSLCAAIGLAGWHAQGARRRRAYGRQGAPATGAPGRGPTPKARTLAGRWWRAGAARASMGAKRPSGDQYEKNPLLLHTPR
jgi:hypothetical protein